MLATAGPSPSICRASIRWISASTCSAVWPFEVVARDGETLGPSARFKADTINIAPGQRYEVIWKALKPGKWLIHRHIAHHTTNNNVETEGGGGLMMVIDVR